MAEEVNVDPMKRSVQELAKSKSGFYEVLYQSEKQLGMSVVEGLFRCASLSELKTYLETLKNDEYGKNIQFVSEHGSYYDTDDLLTTIAKFEKTSFITEVPKIMLKDQNFRDKVFKLVVSERQEEAQKNKELEEETKKVLDLLLGSTSVEQMTLILKTVHPDMKEKMSFKKVTGETVSYADLVTQFTLYQESNNPKDISRVDLGAMHLRDKVISIEQQKQNQQALKKLFELGSLKEIIDYLRIQSDKNNSIQYRSKNSAYSPSKLHFQLSLFDAGGNVTYIPSISYNGVTLEDRIKEIDSSK